MSFYNSGDSKRAGDFKVPYEYGDGGGQPSSPPMEKEMGGKGKHFSEDSTAHWQSGIDERTMPAEVGSLRHEHHEHHDPIEDTVVEKYEPQDVKRTRWQKTRRHCVRFWICYLLLGIIISAIMIPITLLVIFPLIVQAIVSGTPLQLHQASLLFPNQTSLALTLSSTFKVPAGFRVKLEPMNLTLYRKNTKPMIPYQILPLPAQNLKGNATIAVANIQCPILNETEFVAFLNDALYNKNFQLSVVGSTQSHIGALKAHIKLEKTINVTGLDRFNGFSVDSAWFVFNSPEGNLRGNLTIPNHSILTFTVGDLTLNLGSAGILLGNVVVRDFELRPGNNTFPFVGNLDFPTLLANFATVVRAQATALQRGNLALDTTTNSTIYQGNHLEYYEQSLRALTLTSELPLTNLLVGTIGSATNDSAGNISSIVNTVQDVLGATSGVTSLLTSLFPQLSGIFNGTVTDLGNTYNQIVGAVQGIVNGTDATNALETIVGALNNVSNGAADAGAGVANISSVIGDVLGGATTEVTGILGQIGDLIGNITKRSLEKRNTHWKESERLFEIPQVAGVSET